MEVIAQTTTPVVAVALNDTALAANINTKVAAATLVVLEQRRQQWETTVYRTSNQQLYALLADCMEYGRPMEVKEAKERSKELEVFFAERGYTVKKESPLFSRIVKAVFGNVDRRRISTYSLVLRSAQAEGVKSADLANWIEQRGGIQEVRMARSETYVSPKQKAEKAKSSLDSLPNLAVAKEGLAQLADAEFIGTECVLLAEQQADGTFHIKSLIRNATAVNAALAALYAEQYKAAA